MEGGNGPKYTQLLGVLEQAHKDSRKKVAIELQRNPDPDAMSCALVMQDVCIAKGLEATITHAGEISHPSNIVMKTRLDIKTTCYAKDALLPENYDAFIFLDHSGGTSPWRLDGKIPDDRILAVVDHHDLERTLPDIPYVDRRRVGASATIVAEYLMQGLDKELGITDHADPRMQRYTTALVLGIRSDTRGLTRNVTTLDDQAYTFLRPCANMPLVCHIENSKWTKTWMDLLGKAIVNRETKNGVCIAIVGNIAPSDHDVLGMIADKLMEEKGHHTVYVAGIQPDKYDVSIRTEDETLRFDKLLEILPDGTNGGGKDGAGGLQIPNTFSGSFLDKGDQETVHIDLLKQRLMEYLMAK